MIALLMIVRISVVIAVALVFRMVIRHHSAALRHWVLAVGIAVAGALPVVATILPAWQVAPSPSSARITPSAPAGTGVETSIAFDSAAPVARPTRSVGPSAATSLPNAVFAVVSCVWAAGSALGFAFLVVGVARLRWLTRGARAIASGPWVTTADELREVLHIRRRIALVQTDHPTLLASWGWRHPTIAIPAAADSWSGERIRIVLGHELAHIRRNDWLIQIGGELLRAVHWFNPLAWIAADRLRRDSEYACDDVVLAAGIDGRTYASHLVELARTFDRARHPWVPVSMMAPRRSLERRVTAMLNPQVNRTTPTRRARAIATVFLVATAIPIAAVSPQETFSTVSGVVTDQMDRAIPNVPVTVTDPVSHEQHEVRTDRVGHYRVPGVAPGSYVLTISEPGFTPLRERLVVGTADLQKNFELHIGTLQETIVVRDNTPLAPVPADRQARRSAADERYRQAVARCTNRGPGDTGGNVLAPLKMVDVKPLYPDALRDAKIGGTVTMEALIGVEGVVRDVRILSAPDPGLAHAASDAVGQWAFTPTLLNCTPIEVTMHVTTTFVPQP